MRLPNNKSAIEVKCNSFFNKPIHISSNAEYEWCMTKLPEPSNHLFDNQLHLVLPRQPLNRKVDCCWVLMRTHNTKITISQYTTRICEQVLPEGNDVNTKKILKQQHLRPWERYTQTVAFVRWVYRQMRYTTGWKHYRSDTAPMQFKNNGIPN